MPPFDARPCNAPPCNAARGEVAAVLAGVPRRLCLTLGGLAQMEAAFGCADGEALAMRLRKLSAADMIVVLAALLRGGGEAQAAADLADAQIDPREAADAIAAAFTAAAA